MGMSWTGWATKGWARFALLSALVFSPVLAQAQAFLQTYDARGNPAEEIVRFGTAQRLDYNTTTKSVIAVLPANATAVQIVCSTACHIAQASTPASATTSSFLLPANTIQKLRVGGVNDSISVLANSSNGTLWVVILN